MVAPTAAPSPIAPAMAGVAPHPVQPTDTYRLFRRIVPPELINQRQPHELIPRRRRYDERKRRPPDPSPVPGSGPVHASGVGNASDANTHQQL